MYVAKFGTNMSVYTGDIWKGLKLFRAINGF